MIKEISDKVEANGKAILKRGAPRGSIVPYFDGCHAEVESTWRMGGNIETQLGILAFQAGYQMGEKFEYTIIIDKKK